MTRGESVLAAAAREIGYHEGYRKSNKFGEWFGMDNQPWCVIFAAAWCYNQAGIIGDVVGRKYAEHGLYSCSQTLNWYKKNEPECITDTPVRGCLVIFDFPKTSSETDHMGLFVSKTNDKITTIDGNTNNGYVQQRQRYFKDLVSVTYIVPNELNEEMTIADFIRDITPEQVYELACKMYPSDLYKVYSRLMDYMATLPIPKTWNATEVWQKAIDDKITDGTRPMCPATRLETAAMVERKK